MTTFCYCNATDTIRTLPENYQVASRDLDSGGHWLMDAHSALPLHAVLFVTTVLYNNHDIRWGTGLKLLAAITPYDIASGVIK